jgi:hypothetical protein
VVVQRAPGAGRWLQQRDLALIRGEPEYSLLENVALLPRAATYDRLPNYVRVLEAHDARLAVGPAAHTEAVAQRRSALSWRAGDVAGPGVVWLASAEDERWGASVEGRGLGRVDGGWGNAFALPSGAAGELVLAYDRSAADVLWPLAFALLWIVALGAAFAGVRAAPPAEVAR